MAMTAIGYRPDAGSATCRRPYAPSQPKASPMAAPIASSRVISPSRAYQCSTGPAVEKATTRMTTGASLKPDSASSTPVRRAGSGTLRSTEKTAAASVEDTTAPISSAWRQSSPAR